jgi:3D (Asp-Asp-Asp) domain-containing protein
MTDKYPLPAAGHFAQPIVNTPDQDPIFDHENGTRTAVTSAVNVLVPPAGCKYVRVHADGACFITTDGTSTPGDNADSAKIVADQPEIIPVTEGVAIKAFATTSTVVRCLPLKARA